MNRVTPKGEGNARKRPASQRKRNEKNCKGNAKNSYAMPRKDKK